MLVLVFKKKCMRNVIYKLMRHGGDRACDMQRGSDATLKVTTSPSPLRPSSMLQYINACRAARCTHARFIRMPVYNIIIVRIVCWGHPPLHVVCILYNHKWAHGLLPCCIRAIEYFFTIWINTRNIHYTNNNKELDMRRLDHDRVSNYIN